MNTESIDPFKDVLIFSGVLPVRWQTLDHELDDNELLICRQHNSHVLETVLAIDDPMSELESTEDHSTQQIKRLDNKLNLLLHWTACLMQQSQQLPAPLTVKISRYGLSIGDGFDVQAGTTLLVECFPASYFPQALKFYGSVQEAHAGELVVTFKELGDHVEDLLDKFIFRWHRRSVALLREHKASDSTD